MEQNPIYLQYAAQFADATLPSLVKSFNSQVGNHGFNSRRAAHDCALIDELKRRGLDLSAIMQENSISFAHRVRLSSDQTALVLL